MSRTIREELQTSTSEVQKVKEVIRKLTEDLARARVMESDLEGLVNALRNAESLVAKIEKQDSIVEVKR